MYRWTNQKHLKSPKCKLYEKTQNINNLYIECKRNKKIQNHFQKCYKNLTNREYTPLQHILLISALSLPSKNKKLVLTWTIATLTHIIIIIIITNNNYYYVLIIIIITSFVQNCKCFLLLNQNSEFWSINNQKISFHLNYQIMQLCRYSLGKSTIK